MGTPPLRLSWLRKRLRKKAVKKRPEPVVEGMNFRVVPLKDAEKCLKGHKSYLAPLRNEYANPKGFGNISDCLNEMSDDEEEFETELFEWLNESENVTRFVVLAMLGCDPDESHWG